MGVDGYLMFRRAGNHKNTSTPLPALFPHHFPIWNHPDLDAPRSFDISGRGVFARSPFRSLFTLASVSILFLQPLLPCFSKSLDCTSPSLCPHPRLVWSALVALFSRRALFADLGHRTPAHKHTRLSLLLFGRTVCRSRVLCASARVIHLEKPLLILVFVLLRNVLYSWRHYSLIAQRVVVDRQPGRGRVVRVQSARATSPRFSAASRCLNLSNNGPHRTLRFVFSYSSSHVLCR